MSHLDTVMRKYGGPRADGTETPDKTDKTPSVTEFEDAPDVHSAKERSFGTSVSSVDRQVEKTSRNFVTSVSASKKHFDTSIPSNTKSKNSSRRPNTVPTKPTKVPMSPLKQRRLRVLQDMAEDKDAKKYYWLTDVDSDPDFVILTLAVRHTATCELMIPKDRYDPFLLLEILDNSEF